MLGCYDRYGAMPRAVKTGPVVLPFDQQALLQLAEFYQVGGGAGVVVGGGGGRVVAVVGLVVAAMAAVVAQVPPVVVVVLVLLVVLLVVGRLSEVRTLTPFLSALPFSRIRACMRGVR
jgi:hypothetical protein